jgi:hypothetical protein
VTPSATGWPVVYYRAADGTEPVDAFIDALEPKVQVVLDNQIERIALFLLSYGLLGGCVGWASALSATPL